MSSIRSDSASLNFVYLEKLEHDLQEASNRKVFLKVVQEHGARHVEVVQGGFWNFFARVASFFHVKSYDRTQISKVFQEQLYNIENEKLDADVDSLQSSIDKITDLFVEHIQSDELVRNPRIDSDENQRIVSDITECKQELFYILRRSLESTATGQTGVKTDLEELIEQCGPVYKEFGIGVGGKTAAQLSDYFKNDELKELHNLFNDIKRIGFFKDYTPGTLAHTLRVSVEGALDVQEQALRKDSTSDTDWLDAFRRFAMRLNEARCIRGAFTQNDAAFFDMVQNRRAVLLMELRSLVLRAEEVAAPLLLQEPGQFVASLSDIKEKLGCSQGYFLPERLSTISEAELELLKNEVVEALSPLKSKWETELGWPALQPRKFAKPLSALISEYDSHVSALQALKKQKEVDGFAVWKSRLEEMKRHQDRESLAYSLFDRSHKLLSQSFATAEPHLNDIQQLVMHNQNAQVALMLRELLYAARAHILHTESGVGKAGKSILLAVKKEIETCESEFIGIQWQYLDKNELEQMQKRVLQVLKPLHDPSALLKGGVTWPKFHKYRRELVAAFQMAT